ncbi:hypothetical protein J2S00_003120 [Caldalkalibacillus uzonensis]|uniref:YugN-like family protein n=1 Tax=Caldalkalibacillus uzonensis TaxID=353224 RepID=A0ABU0CV61_9BACI|nr:YugN family protein [Caldalkalibacillus uzonensis]MDQ0340311.1 hypothetical protein [Caldalkalibacillus uzonensis]
MIIMDTGLEGKEIAIRDLDVAMEHVGFVRWAWDYKRATYDYKYVDSKDGKTYYIRVPAEVVEGIIEDSGHAIVKIGEPYIGVHTFPHGVAYDHDFPKHALNRAKEKLAELNKLLKVKEEKEEEHTAH